jgi:hypothetical protein
MKLKKIQSSIIKIEKKIIFAFKKILFRLAEEIYIEITNFLMKNLKIPEGKMKHK